MGFLNFFSGRSIQSCEQKGDSQAASKAWGNAKLQYDAALDMLEKEADWSTEDKRRLEDKIRHCREMLAAEHRETGINLLESGNLDDAREYFTLAQELTVDHDLKEELGHLLEETDQRFTAGLDKDLPPVSHFLPVDRDIDEGIEVRQDDDHHFAVLISTLPEDVQIVYSAYGQTFRTGYLALNQGEFEEAAVQLETALAETARDAEYIRLELATAYMNLDRLDEARLQLETFLGERPHTLPAYQMLCEIYWEQAAFDKAESMLINLPEELKVSTAAHLLLGETYFRSQRFSRTIAHYQTYLKNYGWNEAVAKALAITAETDGQSEKARSLYAQIMNQCRSCHSRIDPFVKLRYAELSLDAGQTDSLILELYLSLTQEDPENAAVYYEKISAIYLSLGNREEARRFLYFADQLKSQSGPDKST